MSEPEHVDKAIELAEFEIAHMTRENLEEELYEKLVDAYCLYSTVELKEAMDNAIKQRQAKE